MTIEIGVLLSILSVMVILFLTEKIPIDLTAFLGLAVLVHLGHRDTNPHSRLQVGNTRFVSAARFVQVDPGFELIRLEFGERQQQIGDVTFGVHDDGRDIIQNGLFEHIDTQTRFNATRHANNNGMCR